MAVTIATSPRTKSAMKQLTTAQKSPKFHKKLLQNDQLVKWQLLS